MPALSPPRAREAWRHLPGGRCWRSFGAYEPLTARSHYRSPRNGSPMETIDRPAPKPARTSLPPASQGTPLSAAAKAAKYIAAQQGPLAAGARGRRCCPYGTDPGIGNAGGVHAAAPDRRKHRRHVRAPRAPVAGGPQGPGLRAPKVPGHLRMRRPNPRPILIDCMTRPFEHAASHAPLDVHALRVLSSRRFHLQTGRNQGVAGGKLGVAFAGADCFHPRPLRRQ